MVNTGHHLNGLYQAKFIENKLGSVCVKTYCAILPSHHGHKVFCPFWYISSAFYYVVFNLPIHNQVSCYLNWILTSTPGQSFKISWHPCQLNDIKKECVRRRARELASSGSPQSKATLKFNKARQTHKGISLTVFHRICGDPGASKQHAKSFVLISATSLPVLFQFRIQDRWWLFVFKMTFFICVVQLILFS